MDHLKEIMEVLVPDLFKVHPMDNLILAAAVELAQLEVMQEALLQVLEELEELQQF
tara:strand:+ start:472 stop:639 length:168 start_codon:yes stop_codon:yes gene_type:complete